MLKYKSGLGLEPEAVFYFFEKICEIPHGSGHIDEISDYLYCFAKERGLWCMQDSLKNVYIRKEASPGYEHLPGIILQGHMDMVAVKEENCPLDLEKDGLILETADGYLYGRGTSLGGDDGIAVAYALAILDSDTISHPMLEVLFTVNEEVGMDGAIGADLSVFQSQKLINIDSEEEGELLISCAGGLRVSSVFAYEAQMKQGRVYQIFLRNLTGGHSGADIHKGLGNGIHLLARIAEKIHSEEISLCRISGGEKDNAIPRFASAVFCVEEGFEEILLERANAEWAEIQREYSMREPFMEFGAEALEEYDGKTEDGMCAIIGYSKAREILSFVNIAPDGVIANSMELPGLVETSLNLGVISTTAEYVEADFSLRSSKAVSKAYLQRRICLLTEHLGGVAHCGGDYPAWEYRADSPLRDKMVRIYEKCYQAKPVVTAIHAGLECGILLEKNPELDCISFGPNILDIHTTREKLDILSVKRTWEYLLEILSDKEW